MENPNKDAFELSCFKWLRKHCKREIFGISIFTMLLAVAILISSPESWWAYGIVIPLWFGIHIFRWVHLYKTNVKAYHRWEENFGEKS